MSETTTKSSLTPRDPSLSILKAFAILFVVVAHSGGPSWLVNAAYIFCVPVFFMSTGYFFNLHYLDHPKTYVWHRVRHLYCPFWIWSVIFLVLHNFFFWIGFLSESYGNAEGGVVHPYSWHDFMQHIWSVTFNMSGYDPFLCGAFWFFRTMFISSLAFYALFLLFRKFSRWKKPVAIGIMILLLSLSLAVWQIEGDLRVTGVAQGGYRELMAVAFMSIGFIYRRFRRYFHPRLLFALLGFGLLALFTWLCPSSLSYKSDFLHFVALPLPAFGSFLALHIVSGRIARYKGFFTQSLIYIGDRTLYIFAFHLLAFKLVSILKVLVYGLPWSYVGGHPVVHYKVNGDFFFLLYILAGVGLPLLVMAIWKKMDKSYNLTWYNCLKYSFNGLLIFLVFVKKVLVRIARAFWKSVVGFFHDLRDFIKASNPKDE